MTTNTTRTKAMRTTLVQAVRRRAATVLALGTLGAGSALGAFPEPDVVLYGKVKFDGRNMKQSDKVVVQARLIPMGASVTQTTLGTLSDEYYSLRIPIDSELPVSRPGASVVGMTLYLTVLHNNQVRAQIPYEIREKGLVQELNFGDVDTDTDGLPDGWEQAFLFGLGENGNGDGDNDGLKNSDEYRLGTHPMKVDAPHPADLTPRDGRITIAELSAYYNAWRTQSTWTLAPTTIPIEYVTRATFLWEQGEWYKQDINPTTGSATAPLWWIKASPPSSPAPAAEESTEEGIAKGLDGTNAVPEVALSTESRGGRVRPAGDPAVVPLVVSATLPERFEAGKAAVVRFRAEVFSGMRTYAVEDRPPEGWKVVSVGDGGTYDAATKKVKWGPYFDRMTREMSYTVVPDVVESTQRFEGQGSYDGLLVPVKGRRGVMEDPATVVGRFVVGAEPAAWSIQGAPGTKYRVDVSTDLQNWTVLTNGQADGAGWFRFGPAMGEESEKNFVRAVGLGTQGDTRVEY